MTKSGLSQEQVVQRRLAFGLNEIPAPRRRSFAHGATHVIREPMVLLLISCAILYFASGEWRDGIFLSFSVIVVMAITIVQEFRSGRALEALRSLSRPHASVVRDGKIERISSSDLVPDDILYLSEGDRIAADAVVLDSMNLHVDQSLLTGESEPVAKPEAEVVHCGGLVTRGFGYATITATGTNTELGKIGLELTNVTRPSALQMEISKLVLFFGALGSGVSVLVIALYLVRGWTWVQALLVGLAVAMSLLPEEMPIVTTIFLALGALKLARRQVLVRHVGAAASLGGIDVLCVDKTGTLTVNQMMVRETRVLEGEKASTDDVLYFARLASRPDPIDPMEVAIREACELKGLAGPSGVRPDSETSLTSSCLVMRCLWTIASERIVAAKGAPEHLIRECGLSPDREAHASDLIRKMCRRGLRVLAVAKGREERPLEFLGLIGFEDPVRSDVPAAIEECERAGIRVVMMTGDHPETAACVAAKVGLRNKALRTGSDLEAYSDQELVSCARETDVFARTRPEQKLKIVRALQRIGHVVAMTGDGVNDAPALRAADVGVAMGKRGTDVAREAADLVLLDDSFATLVSSVKLGRTIFRNLERAIDFVISVHVPIAGMSLLPAIFGMPLILLPAEIVFLELVIDPSCTLVFEALDSPKEIMTETPSSFGRRVFRSRNIVFSSLQGTAVFIVLATFYAFNLRRGESEEANRTVTFFLFVYANLMLVAVHCPVNELWNNVRLQIITFLTLAALVSIMSWPELRSSFKFVSFPPASLLPLVIAMLLVTSTILILQAVRLTLDRR